MNTKQQLKKILFVDDEIKQFHLLKDFSKQYCQMDYAPNGLKGLNLFKKSNYDIIFTDYNMPVMNGLEFIRKIRKINKTIPIYIITGNIDLNIKNIPIILKPYKIETILNIIKKQ